MQEITQDDIESATRGLDITKMDFETLTELALQHSDKEAFASRVIRKAAIDRMQEIAESYKV